MAGRNIHVSEASRPVLPRHAKLKFDETRQVWVILAPERVLAPDEIAVEVLQLCDGVRSVGQMVDQLAAKYVAERGAIWTDVIALLQIPFSGGEPTARKDLVQLVQHASDVGLYSNLITSAVLLTRERLSALADAGLSHVQISFQGNEPVIANRVAGLKGAHEKKI